MTYRHQEVIYILTTEDVNDVARELNMPRPSKRHYQSIRRSVERSFAYGPMNWHDAIVEALAQDSGLSVTKRSHRAKANKEL